MWTRQARHFLRDEAGAITILALVFFIMVFALGALVVDVGRLFNLHSQAQVFVDQAALAAAAELDGNPAGGSDPGAVQRALHAVDLILEKQNFADGSHDLQVGQVIFLSSLGSTDPAAPGITPAAGDAVLMTCTRSGGGWSCPTVPNADFKAQYVAVSTTALTQTHILLPLLDILSNMGGGTSRVTTSFTIAPQATAGFQREVCNNAPLMMCNPYENTGSGQFTPVRGQEMIVTQGLTAGSYGVLCPNGSTCRDLLATKDPNTKCVSVKLPGKPGTTTGPIDVGMNVRFDMYDSPFKANKEGKDPEYAPAPNVTKGQANVSTSCGESASTNSMPPPDDNCFMQSPTLGAGTGCGTFAGTSIQHGDGNWARNAYWTLNHGGTPPSTICSSLGCVPYSTASRYDVYRYEIEQPQQVLTSQESGAPKCATTTPDSDPNHDRRVLIMAIANCGVDTQQVVAFGKFFLLEPLNSPFDGKSVTVSGQTYKWKDLGASHKTDLRLEMISRITPGAPDGVLHEYPVLYR